MTRDDLKEKVVFGPMDTSFFYGQERDEAVAYHKQASDLGGLQDKPFLQTVVILPDN